MRTAMIVAAAVLIAAAALLVWRVGLQHDDVTDLFGGWTATVEYGGGVRSQDDNFSGYGWSINPNTEVAVNQALSAARGLERRRAQIVFVTYTCQHSPERVARAVREKAGPQAAIYGRSSDYGLVAPDGYHRSPAGVVGVLLVSVEGMAVGVGSADLDRSASPESCAVGALKKAQAGAGLAGSDDDLSMVLISPTHDGAEEKYVETITRVTGGNVPVLGGTVGKSDYGGAEGSAVANDRVVRKGLVVAVFRTKRTFAWDFGGGFDRTNKNGVITASTGREITKINGRPALDVYDEWAGGRITEALRNGENVNTVAALYPLCRTVSCGGKSRNLFVHVWPPADGLTTRRLISSANLHKGDVVHFSEGSWNILLNRISLLPKRALEKNDDFRPAAGFLICCEGVLKNIPEPQRNQLAQLLNNRLGDTPWLGSFSWGEQGNFRGIGNYHGNLLTSLVLFPNGGSAK